MRFNVRIWWLTDSTFSEETCEIEADSRPQAFQRALEKFRDVRDTLFFLGLEGEPELFAARFLEGDTIETIPMPWARRR